MIMACLSWAAMRHGLSEEAIFGAAIMAFIEVCVEVIAVSVAITG